MLAIRIKGTSGPRSSAFSDLLLVVLGLWLDLGEDREADQSDEGHGHAIHVQEATPGLAQKHDAQHHQPYGPGFQVPCAQVPKRHFLIAPKVTPRSRCLRNTKVKIATGKRTRRVPAAIAVQSVTP